MKKVPFSACSFPVPPVCTAQWNQGDWIRYAQSHNPKVEIYDDGENEKDGQNG